MDADYGIWSNEYGKNHATPELRSPVAEYAVCYPNALQVPTFNFPLFGQQHSGVMFSSHDQVHQQATYPAVTERTGVMNEIHRLLVTQRPEDVSDSFRQSPRLLGQVTTCDKAVQTLRSKCCGFCRKNGETPQVYRAHCLKCPCGKLTCPILRKYVCPLCKATGDDAHTVRYCPKNRDHGASAFGAASLAIGQRFRCDRQGGPKSPGGDNLNSSA